MKPIKTYGAFFALLFAALLMTACAGGPVEPAKTFEQKLAYAYATHTAVLEAAANATELGTLSVDDAMQVLRLADESRVLLDASRAAIGVGDVTTAEGQYELAINLLTQLQTYVNSKAVKK